MNPKPPLKKIPQESIPLLFFICKKNFYVFVKYVKEYESRAKCIKVFLQNK